MTMCEQMEQLKAQVAELAKQAEADKATIAEGMRLGAEEKALREAMKAQHAENLASVKAAAEAEMVKARADLAALQAKAAAAEKTVADLNAQLATVTAARDKALGQLALSPPHMDLSPGTDAVLGAGVQTDAQAVRAEAKAAGEKPLTLWQQYAALAGNPAAQTTFYRDHAAGLLAESRQNIAN